MRDLLPFLVVGISSGAVYALAAMGLVVTYTTSGVFNFAHGAVGMVAAFLYFTFTDVLGMAPWLAAALPVLVIAPLVGLLIDRLLLGRLDRASSTTAVVVSLGLLVALQGLIIIVYGGTPKVAQPLFPEKTFSLGSALVTYQQAAITIITFASSAVLYLFLRRTHLGLQMRSVVAAPELSGLVGTNRRLITSMSWMLGSGFAALAAVLSVQTLGVNAVALVLLVVQSFGAAAVGRLTSLPLTLAGAVSIGVVVEVSKKFIASTPSLAGLPDSLPFIVLFLVLVLSRPGTLREVTADRPASDPPPRLGGTNPYLLAALAVLFALLVPAFIGSGRMIAAAGTVAFVLIFASLSLVVGLARQLSLCHATFVGLGAAWTAQLAHHMPFLLALLCAAFIIVPLGALIALPAIRLSGLFLALATFGFGVLVFKLIYSTDWTFTSGGQLSVQRPMLLGLSLRSDIAYYYFTLTVTISGVLAVLAIRRGRLGRILQALADSQPAVESIGITPTVARLVTFSMSAFLAALAGGVIAGAYENFSSSNFDYFQSLLWLTVLVTAGTVTISGSVLAAVLFIAAPVLIDVPGFGNYLPVLFGVLAIIFAQSPLGLVGVFSRDWSRLLARDRWRLERSPVRARLTVANEVTR